LTAKDPILSAFLLSWELRRLSFEEHEFRSEYQVSNHDNVCFMVLRVITFMRLDDVIAVTLHITIFFWNVEPCSVVDHC
jgi:hypothetical protein